MDEEVGAAAMFSIAAFDVTSIFRGLGGRLPPPEVLFDTNSSFD